jgi:hypothetical protein
LQPRRHSIAEFGLAERAPGTFATSNGGEQLRLLPATRRGLVELGVGADDRDDLRASPARSIS